MIIIGLTGGIGSGKTTVADLFASLGVPIIDADVIARQVVEPGQPALNEIIAAFGQEVVDQTGHLNRGVLRDLVFTDVARRRQLEAILHPRILMEMRIRAQKLRCGYCIFVIPLLFEADQTKEVNRVLVVDCDDDIRRKRVMERDKLSPEQMSAIMAAQLTRQQRLAGADDVIHNDSDLNSLRSQVNRLHDRYKSLVS